LRIKSTFIGYSARVPGLYRNSPSEIERIGMEKLSTFWFVQGLLGKLAEEGVPTFKKHLILQTLEKAAKDLIPGGLADDKKPDAAPGQLEKGIKVEMEHTDDPEIAKEIAQDHLEESSRYYDHLEEMEEEMEKKHAQPFYRNTQQDTPPEYDPRSKSENLKDVEEISPEMLAKRKKFVEALREQGLDVSEKLETAILSGKDPDAETAEGDDDVNEMTEKSDGVREELPLSSETETSDSDVNTVGVPTANYNAF